MFLFSKNYGQNLNKISFRLVKDSSFDEDNVKVLEEKVESLSISLKKYLQSKTGLRITKTVIGGKKKTDVFWYKKYINSNFKTFTSFYFDFSTDSNRFNLIYSKKKYNY